MPGFNPSAGMQQRMVCARPPGPCRLVHLHVQTFSGKEVKADVGYKDASVRP